MSAESAKRVPVGHTLNRRLKWVMLTVVVLAFVVLLYPSLVVHQHQYQLGDIAQNDVKAPQDFFIEDHDATLANQKKVIDKILTVYDHDTKMRTRISSRVINAFETMRQIMATVDAQQNEAVDNNPTAPEDVQSDGQSEAPKTELEREKALWAHKADFEKQIGIQISPGAFKLLASEGFSPSMAEIIIKIQSDILLNGIVGNKEILLKEADRGITLRNVARQTEKTVYALRPFYGPDQAKTMVRIVAEPLVKGLNYNLINLIVDFSQRLLHPNITLNRNETEKRKKQALESNKPIMYKIKAGEMLLREGERVSSLQLLKLRALERQKEKQHIPFTAMGAALLLGALLIAVYRLYLHQPRHTPINTNQNLFFLTLVLMAVLVLVKAFAYYAATFDSGAPFPIPASAVTYLVPAASGAMLVCLFIGFDLALPFSLIVAVCAALLFGDRIEILLFFMLNQAMAAYWVQHSRERRVVIAAGVKLGLLNIVLTAVISIYTSDMDGTTLLWNGVLSFLGGLGCGIVTVGMAPLVEMAFRYTTDISLLELANLDRPILRRLMIEAPGTYHHSVIVGSLVEAAATEIGANPLLAKVCGYYHDIGKVKKPLYFIENQRGGSNRHDKLAPSMSSLILIAHVRDGVDIARKNKLGKVIIDTIEQHHGTSLIRYFYDKAKRQKGGDAVKIDAYRYPGPKPQTKEAGLVMLADVVEAASRTLDNPTPARIQGLVQNLINRAFSDGQLDSCELTLKDLHCIAKSFNKILNAIHHHRIEYTDVLSKEGKESDKEKNGRIDRQSTGKSPRNGRNRSKESPRHLKRLGLS